MQFHRQFTLGRSFRWLGAVALLLGAFLVFERVSARVTSCPLTGEWSVILWRDTLSTQPPRATTTVTGSVTLGDTLGPGRPQHDGQWSPTWRGSYDIDPTPLFVPDEASISSTAVGYCSDESICGVHAHYFEPGRVYIDLSPYVSHGPISLSGTLARDTILGSWYQRSGDEPFRTGRFAMYRTSSCSDRET